ncbi:MAG: NAD-dependent epimerase/dehydratase family protein [Desulfobulbaceae bacterium]|nr:NAD-dependent epimerase/dehydratase family protein [Desulfobulbaceae bacterium]
MQPILITGGAGFIGSNLVDNLLAQGCHVRVLDNFSTGKRDNLPQTNPALEILEGDITDSGIVQEAVQGVSAVVHLAAVASVQASVETPGATHQANFIGTLNLLEACRRNSIKRFIFSSSAAVYGDTKTIPTPENTPPNPLTPYAADKLASEHYINFYHRQYGLDAGIFRFFNVYGPRQAPSSPYSGVISIFTNRLLTGQKIEIFGNGEQTRDFVFVTDLVNLLYKALKMDNMTCLPINIGTGVSTSLNGLLQTLESITGLTIQVIYRKQRSGDIRTSLADVTLLQKQFGITSMITIQQGLERLLDSA